MKYLIYIFVIVLMSACAGRISIMKRHYGNGFHIHVAQKPVIRKQSQEHRAARPVKTMPEEVPAIEEVVAVDQPAATEPVRAHASRTQIIPRKAYALPITQAEAKPMAAAGHLTPERSFRLLETAASSGADKRPSASTNKILLIILCIIPLVCLIAVYLHDNAITMNFWLSLILHITLVAYWLFPLLICLDVINFA